MSQENVDAFLAASAAANRDDWEAFIEMSDPDIVFIPQRAPVQGAYQGHEDLRRFAQDTRETFDVFESEYPDVRDLGDRVLGLGTLRIRGKGSGIDTEVPSSILVRYRDGLVVRFEDFGDPQAALEAAGLTE